jgi:hypothetical protein
VAAWTRYILLQQRLGSGVYRFLNHHGENAGSLAEWDETDDATLDDGDFTLDIGQIAEIEF